MDTQAYANGITATVEIEARAHGTLVCETRVVAARSVAFNRAGFNVLIPPSMAGQDVLIVHPDGTEGSGRFPRRISPEQPFRPFSGLRYSARGIHVALEFDGADFEIEDQRNWSDASFKAYCPPLNTPRPLRLEAGEHIRQRIALRVTGRPAAPERAAADTRQRVILPEILLAAEPAWLAGALPPQTRYLARFCHRTAWPQSDLAALAAAGPCDLEIVLPSDPDEARSYADTLARDLRRSGIRVARVVALAEPYLKRIPAGACAPGLDPAAAAGIAARCFPEAVLGLGSLTHFTELNRSRPPRELGAFITHGNAATVHAADDASVLETLEGLVHVMHSAQAIAGSRAYRLGLVALAMRSNPHGQALVANPRGEKIPMTADDPRQGDSFAASYAICAVALAAEAGAQAICLGAMAGPFAITRPDGTPRPIGYAIRTLAALSGRACSVTRAEGLLELCVDGQVLTANCNLARRRLGNGTPRVGTLLHQQHARPGRYRDLPPMSCLISTAGEPHQPPRQEHIA
ncbi:hypothetical protein DXV76_00850 [Rhodobacteraceae bacterium CCMM004]|nr:hypothetical protein DXV76_00850 [Rhodobacteraceae bacterium CCMM004]